MDTAPALDLSIWFSTCNSSSPTDSSWSSWLPDSDSDDRSDSSTIENAKTASTSTFVTALWLNAIVFAVELIAFTLLRKKFKAVYEPRTYIPEETKRSPPLTERLLAWPIGIFKADFHAIKHQNGMDAYFFVRYLRMMVKIFLPIWILSWAILLPINSVKTGTGRDGLDMFTFGNVGPTVQSRYWAHLVLVWVFTIWIFYVIKYEMRLFVTTRQRHLIDPVHSASAQANTILVTGVPTKYLSEKALTKLFGHMPGGVRKVWLNRDLKDLPKLYDRRLKACNKLESAETALLGTATKLYNKQEKTKVKASAKHKKTDDSSSNDVLAPAPTPNGRPSTSSKPADADKEKALPGYPTDLVPAKKRPSHRLPIGPLPFALPLIGKKVDSIEWAREEIRETTEELERRRAVLRHEVSEEQAQKLKRKAGGVAGMVGLGAVKHRSLHKDKAEVADDAGGSNDDGTQAAADADRESIETYPPLNSAFILFHTQIAAHLAAQSLTHNEPYRMAQKYTEVAPADVVWGNLGLNPYEMKVRKVISYAMTAGLIILWAFPVAFIGAVSNVYNLCSTYSWLSWLCTLPKVVVGILQGVLPPLLLLILMMLLPIVLRLLASFEGIPRKTGVELSLMTRYFLFQVLHSFLIVTLSSGIIAALPGLVENPTSVPSLLAAELPQASNFFLTYIILQGLAGTASGFLQIGALIIYYVKLFILGSTPRSVFMIKYTLRDIQWGTLFPATTLIVVIALAYSIISPIINGLACFALFLYYQMWKYLFLYQLEQPAAGDTGGLFFPKAIQHLFVGLYIQHICLAALFFLSRDASDSASSIPQGALMIVLIVVTAFFHMIINNSYGPLLHSLPLTLAHKSYGMSKHRNSEQGKIGEAKDGFGGSKPTSSGSSRSEPETDSDEEADAKNEPNRPAAPTGKQAVKEDFSKPVAQEGKRNEDPTDFYHPASVEPLRVVWIPRDTLGMAQVEVAENRAEGLPASCENAVMDEKGHVDITGHPPADAR